MPIYARIYFQSKNEISDKLMRNDFNAISIRNTARDVADKIYGRRFYPHTQTRGEFLIDGRLTM